MANWSYIGTPYAGREKVRAIIGDTDSDDPIIDDHEIAAVLAVYPNETEAAAHICRNMAAQFAIEGNVTHGKYRFESLEKAKHFRALSAELFKQVYGMSRPLALAGPSFGGVSKTAKDANEANTDNVEPKFYRSQFEDPDEELDDGAN